MNLRKEKRRSVEPDEIDITSLLDVLVILLVFLLKSFNSSDLTVDLIDNLALPYSYSETLPKNGVVLQTDAKKNIYLNNKLVTNLNRSTASTVIVNKLKEIEKDLPPRAGKKDDDSKLINLVLDQRLAYQDIDQLLKIVERAGFNKYKLLTQGKE